MEQATQEAELRPADIWQARARLRPHVWRTPLLHSAALSERTRCQVYLKMECWQLCGCFKVRGAINMVSALPPTQQARGLVTASSGNHGIAMAYAARLLGGLPATVFLPEGADRTKVRKIEALGAEARLGGAHYLAALDRAQAHAAAQGATYVHSHAHPLIMAGQGTIGLEIVEELPDVQAIVTPIGGGGLVSGVAVAAKSMSDRVRIIGVEPTAAPGAYLSFRDGVCRERIELKPTIADGLSGGLAPLAWQVARHLIEQVVLVEDVDTARAMRAFLEDEQLIIEGASAVTLAALLTGGVDLRGQRVALILSGRNIAATRFADALRLAETA
ncbi:MAG: threonine/serine dehydratase [Chloroflexi bacterium]|nr:threonine/serine dehydratase [Chloroflexota bacterium]